MGLFGGRRRVFDAVPKLTGAHAFRMEGRAVTCPQCGSDRFEAGTALLNTPGMTFVGLDWANRTASILACTRCSHVEWFLRPPEVTQ